ncbi:MAG: hypothetical protein WCH40_09785 [Verrucomicrobiales bacterium]
MKTTFSNLCLFVILSLSALAQNGKPEVGFIRLVQAVGPGTGKASLFIDGENMFPGGYDLGQRTGGIGLKAGPHTFEVRKEGIEKAVTKIDLKNGETQTIIAFGEKIPPKKEDDPPTWTIKLLRLKQQDTEKSFRMTLVSVSAQPEILVTTAIESLKKNDISSVKRLNTATVDLGKARGDVNLSINKEPLAFVSLDDHGNYVVLLYDDADGKVHAITFLDPQFVVAG